MTIIKTRAGMLAFCDEMRLPAKMPLGISRVFIAPSVSGLDYLVVAQGHSCLTLLCQDWEWEPYMGYGQYSGRPKGHGS